MLYINGRFLTQPLSGVQRYARELLQALDLQLARSAGLSAALGRIEVLIPDIARSDLPNWQVLQPRIVPGGAGHLWEQTTLYRASRDGTLLSLANSGPVRHPAHILTLHDAHIFQMPDAFSRSYRLWHRGLRPVLARRAAGLITVSGHSVAELGRHLALDPERFRIVPNAADHLLRLSRDPAVPARYGLVAGQYLLAVGNQSPNKNIEALIRAHTMSGPEVFPLALVGGAAPGLVARANTATDRVRLLGRVPDTDLRGLYEGAAGFVFPSLNEGFGIPPLEAMQLGVPVLCARSGAMPEVLGSAPLWFDPRDTGDMADVLRRFVKMPKLMREARAARGLRQAARYRWDKSASVLVDAVLPILHPAGSEPLKGHVQCDGNLIGDIR